MVGLLNGQVIKPADRDVWIQARKQTLGASETGAVCGVSPYASPLDVYLQKVGLGEPVEETLPMWLGTKMESIIAELYEKDVPTKVVRQQIYARSLERPHLSATIDGIDANGNLVEFKTVGIRSAHMLGDEDTDQLPDSWICQAMSQSYVAETSGLDVDFSKVEFAVLVAGQDFRRYTVNRDEALLASLLLRLDAFWERVVNRDPPPVSHASDASLMRFLHPRDDGDLIPADETLASLATEYQSLGKAEKAAKESRDLAKAKILEALGDHSGAILPDGSRVTRKIISRKETTIVQKACSYPQLYFSKAKGGE